MPVEISGEVPYQRPIERFYEPGQLKTASPLRRLCAYLIDYVAFPTGIYIAFVIIAVFSWASEGNLSDNERIVLIASWASLIAWALLWIAWWCVCAARGQTPAKRLLSMYVIKRNGTRAGFLDIFIRELLVKLLLFFGIAGAFTFQLAGYLAAAWCIWDRDRQCLWDKVTSTYVAHSPSGFVPEPEQTQQTPGRLPPSYHQPTSV